MPPVEYLLKGLIGIPQPICAERCRKIVEGKGKKGYNRIIMKRLIKFCILLLLLFFIVPPISLRLAYAQASFYKYVDKDGNIHFTDSLDSIPEEYRTQIKIYREQKTPKPALSEEEGAAEEKSLQLKEAEEKKKEAEEKALQEKAAREEKDKEQKEVQDRIADLQQQIRAKQEEQGSLRTTWMVYDRIRLNQLNAEIAGLVQEINSLQQELAEKQRE